MQGIQVSSHYSASLPESRLLIYTLAHIICTISSIITRSITYIVVVVLIVVVVVVYSNCSGGGDS